MCTFVPFTANKKEVEKPKTGKLFKLPDSKESYGSFKSYGCKTQIHSLLSSKKYISFTCNLLFKYNNMEMVIHSQLEKIRPSPVKIERI